MSEMASSLDVACIDDGVRELFGPCGKPTFSDSTTCFAVLHDQFLLASLRMQLFGTLIGSGDASVTGLAFAGRNLRPFTL